MNALLLPRLVVSPLSLSHTHTTEKRSFFCAAVRQGDGDREEGDVSDLRVTKGHACARSLIPGEGDGAEQARSIAHCPSAHALHPNKTIERSKCTLIALACSAFSFVRA
jgi:hypothetical protein